MAANFYGIISVKRIFDLLGYVKHRRPTSKEQIVNYLLDKDYKASKRTVERDFQALRDYLDVQISFNRISGVYEIEQMSEDADEKEIENLLGILKLEENLRMGLKTLPKFSNLVSFDHDRYQDGVSKQMRYCIMAIYKKHVIQVTHRKFDSDIPTKRLLIPILVIERAARWYLIAEEFDSKQIKTFGLERIIAIEFAKESAIWRKPQTSADDLKKRLLYNVGVFEIMKEPEWIEVRFSPIQAKYFETQPLSPEWEVKERNDNYVTIAFKAVINQDLTIKLIGLGDEVKVIKPESLVKAITSRFNKMMDNLSS